MLQPATSHNRYSAAQPLPQVTRHAAAKRYSNQPVPELNTASNSHSTQQSSTHFASPSSAAGSYQPNAVVTNGVPHSANNNTSANTSVNARSSTRSQLSSVNSTNTTQTANGSATTQSSSHQSTNGPSPHGKEPTSGSSRHLSSATNNQEDKDLNVGRYRIMRTIGKGNFARVKLARHVLTGCEVAIKIMDKTQMNQSTLQKVYREIRIMKTLDHPNIIKLYEVIETPRNLYLVLEYAANGELFDYLVTHGRMKEKEAREKFRQIVSAVQYLHVRSIVHRDLKDENLLLDEQFNIKLCDFGFANEFHADRKLDTFCGSPPYAAPELYQGRKYDGPEVDTWSLGVILYTLVSGSLPFDGQNLRELREKVIRGKYRIPFYMSTDCENVLKKMLQLVPQRRPTLESLMATDRWLNFGFEDSGLKPYTATQDDFADDVAH